MVHTVPEQFPSRTTYPPHRPFHDVSYCIWHDDVIKWKHSPRYWPFVRGIQRSPADCSCKGQCGAFMFSLICVWTNGWVNNRDAGDLRRHRAILPSLPKLWSHWTSRLLSFMIWYVLAWVADFLSTVSAIRLFPLPSSLTWPTQPVLHVMYQQ